MSIILVERLQCVFLIALMCLRLCISTLQDKTEAKIEEVQTVVEQIFAKVDMTKVLAHYGTKADLSKEASANSSEMEKAKQNLVDCLLLEASILSEVEADKIPFPRLLQIYIDLHKIVDSKDTKLRTFKRKYAELREHFATAAKLLNEEMAEKVPSKEQELQFIKYLEELKWQHCAEQRRKWQPRRFPDNYQLF